MKSVAIIGAGITELIAAFYLKRKSVPIKVAAFDADSKSKNLRP